MSTALNRGSEEMAMNGRAVDAIVRQLTPQLQHDVGAEQWRVGHSRGVRFNQVGSALRRQSSGTRITSEIAMPAAVVAFSRASNRVDFCWSCMVTSGLFMHSPQPLR